MLLLLLPLYTNTNYSFCQICSGITKSYQIKSGDIIDINIKIYLSYEDLLHDHLAFILDEFKDKNYRILVNYTMVPTDIQTKFGTQDLPVGVVIQPISNILMEMTIGEEKSLKVFVEDLYTIPIDLNDTDHIFLKITTLNMVFSQRAEISSSFENFLQMIMFFGGIGLLMIYFKIKVKQRKKKPQASIKTTTKPRRKDF